MREMSNSIPNCPLYETISQPDVSNNPNAGLWYDKFCDRWVAGWKSGLETEGKAEWVKGFCGRYLGDSHLLEETVDRHIKLLKACNGQAMAFKTIGPMVSGLGRSHPVENGFAWHHLLGVPYLPGTSVKGIVRSYATCWLEGDKKIDKSDLMRIFGPRDKSIKVGSVIFMDALPIMPVKLKAEVMTPHYGPYYTGADSEPPGDWHSPVPIPFLAVDEDQEFLFGILPRWRGGEKDCKLASKWLAEALGVMGAGAKTSSGYGRFSKVDLKNKGMRWLTLLSRKQEMDIVTLLKKSPGNALEAWSKVENPKIKYDVAKEIKTLYMSMDSWDRPWGKIKESKRSLEEYFATIDTSSKGAE